MIVNSFRRKYTEPHTNCSTTTDDYNKQLFINKSKLDNTEFQGFIGADEAFRKQDLNLETEIGKSVMELIAKMIKYVWKKEILQRLQELYKLRDEELQTFREAVESLAKMESELVFKTGDGPYEAEIKELEDKLELI
jgi:hypothetical protein